jgi:predicted amidophosphoribosyltransferase
MAKLRAIDDSNRGDHFYLEQGDRCYFLHEFTARQGFGHSPANQFIFNFKKSPLQRHEAHYRYKTQAIAQAIDTYRQLFDQFPSVYPACTFVPIPPSKPAGHPEYDDRMWQVVQGLCKGKGADARELIAQKDAYEAAHLHEAGSNRIKPHQLQDLYVLRPPAPKETVLLFDDVLSAGTHFVAAKRVIQSAYAGTTVVGFFLARRIFRDDDEDF